MILSLSPTPRSFSCHPFRLSLSPSYPTLPRYPLTLLVAPAGYHAHGAGGVVGGGHAGLADGVVEVDGGLELQHGDVVVEGHGIVVLVDEDATELGVHLGGIDFVAVMGSECDGVVG